MSEKTFPSYPSIYTLGHAALRDLFVDGAHVTIEEKVDGCVTPDTPILCSDLVYRPAGSLQIGDTLLAFTDVDKNHKMVESVVTASRPIKKACYLLVLSDGRTVRASHDHPWLTRQKTNNNGKRWVETKDLKAGMPIVALPYWEEECTWEAGYLAGFYDGEGSLVKSRNQRVLSVYQRTGDTLNYLLRLLAEREFNCTVDIRKRREEWQQVASVVHRGGSWTDILKFLGSIRPKRLLADSRKIWDGASLNYVPDVTVTDIQPLGIQVVQGLSTSSKTYIANGLFSHNSQFSFGVTNGELQCRSKRCVLSDPIPDLFRGAVATAKRLFEEGKLAEGVVYRGEAIQKSKHNTLAYDRVPVGNIAIYDIMVGIEAYVDYDIKRAACEHLGLECVPLLYVGPVSDSSSLKSLLERTSFLGGAKIEGFVVKNYKRFGYDKKPLFGKFVSDDFKEIHRGDWKERSPKNGDIIVKLVEKYRTPARWEKACQHLRDDGTLTNSPKDIGPIIVECQADIRKECEEMIKDELFNWAWKQIAHKLVGGLPQWYKDKLLECA